MKYKDHWMSVCSDYPTKYHFKMRAAVVLTKRPKLFPACVTSHTYPQTPIHKDIETPECTSKSYDLLSFLKTYSPNMH